MNQKKLIEDVKPVPIKQRAQTGIVELKLSQNQSLRAVGDIYGVEHIIRAKGYEATLFLDQYNQRIKILKYKAEDFQAMIMAIRWIAEANGFDKIICMASRSDWQKFLRFGYVLEAMIKYYLNGDDAYVMSKFRSQERLSSGSLMEEMLLIEKILNDSEQHVQTPLKENFRVRMAKPDDVPKLISLYQEIFETYPSPLIHSSYFEMVFQKDSIFAVCEDNGVIVSAASAELNHDYLSAELTDCATRKQVRGHGIMTHILQFLEVELQKRNYICSYTMARARSFGMNNVFYRMGYEFLGRLVNNCDIYGAYEDMNIWARRLNTENKEKQA
ncbi:MAG: putative beta-lysine N-acetyltransferase [Oligoflexia bacterium]|nr:putative beta-lysine N-acetyltransferase [Oligoflexia bacterium]